MNPESVGQAAFLASENGVARVQEALAELDLDAWLLYEFRGQNWISESLLGVEATTRRAFILIPREGEPRGLVHAIEGSHWQHWPWPTERYAGWQEMEEKLETLLRDVGRTAAEISPGDAVPTVDLLPHGVVQLLEERGGTLVSSGDLVSAFFSVWSQEQLRAHREAAEVVARVARGAFRRAADAVRAGRPTTEGALSDWIRSALGEGGLTVDVDTHVAVGPKAADPHYAPRGAGETVESGEVLLIDLWGRTDDRAVCADQTWMGILAGSVPDRVQEIWEAVRDARDAAVDFLRERHRAEEEVRGYEVDDVSRAVLRDRGFGEYFIHRTGHSIDRKLHGSGPNLDNLESRDDRRLIRGVGFSVEPGVYIPDEVGVRSEINVHWGPDGPEVTPAEPQDRIFRLLDD